MRAGVAVIGGGPAGLAAALSAHDEGVEDVIILERELELGGILRQCIHDGFGNFVFDEMLTGPEYAQRYIADMEKTGVQVKLNTMVLGVDSDKTITAVNPEDGLMRVDAGAIILAMGCRERTRAQILIPGDRPAGVYTAGVAQQHINMRGLMPGRRVVILGSGDVGLIMARRFTLEGAEVEGVYEIMPHPGGLTRNVVQCLHDYGIPLHLSRTITDIAGRERVEGVTVARVDSDWGPIEGSERFIPCDTVILSVGLIPENELSRAAGVRIDSRTGGPVVNERMETSVPGIFACGNVVNVHDLVDDVSQVATTAGKGAADHVHGVRDFREVPVNVRYGRNVNYVVPQIISGREPEEITFYLRVTEVERNVRIIARSDEDILYEKREIIVKPPEMVKARIASGGLHGLGNELTIGVEP